MFNPALFLTCLRLVLVPVFLLLFWKNFYGWSFAVFVFAAFTDMIDGTVARTIGRPSKTGAILDPVADKLLVEGAFISLWLAGVLPLWFFLLALFRDLLIVSGITYLEIREVEFEYKPSWFGKFATLFQSTVASMGILLFGDLATSWPWSWLWPLTLGAATFFIFSSALIYIRKGMDIIHVRAR